jgi:NAD-dependent SIR2 family protein deacetylase
MPLSASEFGNARSLLKKSRTVVTGVDGRCHVEDVNGTKVDEVSVPNVLAAVTQMSASQDVVAVHTSPGDQQRLAAPLAEAHGSLGKAEWSKPKLTKVCEAPARPGYLTMKAHEYLDEDQVLREKVQVLAGLLKRAATAVADTGAGISTSAGIPDWATKHTKSDGTGTKLSAQQLAAVAASAHPSLAHRVLVAVHRLGLLPKWVQQNHDGLPQKAGFPQAAINEIHGAVFDPSNPLVPMTGTVRDDLYSDLLQFARSADLVLALGTSLAGMGADQLVGTVADRARRGRALGVVIVSLQQTVRDGDAALRIFAPLEKVAILLAEELGLECLSGGPSCELQALHERHFRNDVFSVPYDASGNLLSQGLADATERVMLDLSPGAKLIIKGGPDNGARCTVDGHDSEGNYRLILSASGEVRLLGSWWISAALLGKVGRIPCVSAQQAENP